MPTAGNFNVYISFRETCGYSGCPNSSYPANVVFATTNDTVTGINFAMFDSVYDLSLTALAHVINPGFSSQVRIYYSDLNNSFLPNATVTIAYDSTLIINHTIPAYTTLDSINRIITWNVNNVGAASPNQYVELNINPRLGMPAATSANLLCNITPDSADCDQVNNQLLLQLPIRGSFDPNSKSLTNGSFKQTDSFIDYTIHFQNCGNDSTHFIIVTDTLSPYLDPASVQTLVTSFVPYTFELKQNGILSWRFDGYFLPDSATDPLNSQGLITFRVKLKSDLAFTEPLEQNTAYIYFDYNPSVITNTVADTLAIPLTVFAVNTDKIKIYPNPTNQLLYIEVTDNNEHTIILFDSKGSRLHTKQFSGEVTKLDLSDISSGVYYIEVHNTEQKVWRTKMIKID